MLAELDHAKLITRKTTQPLPKPPDEALGFGKVIADHMLKVRKSEEPWCVCVRACVVVREAGGGGGAERGLADAQPRNLRRGVRSGRLRSRCTR